MPTDPLEESPPPPQGIHPSSAERRAAPLRASREKLRGLAKEMEEAVEESEHRRDDAARE
jgi:hypothetical protein